MSTPLSAHKIIERHSHSTSRAKREISASSKSYKAESIRSFGNNHKKLTGEEREEVVKSIAFNRVD
jgi:hypothetical protein